MLLKFLFKFFNKMEVPWLDHWQLQGRNTPMKDRFPRLHPFVLDDMLTVKASMIYHPWSVTCTTLSPLKPIMSWFNWSPFCHWYLSMLRARTFSTGQPKLVNFDPRLNTRDMMQSLHWTLQDDTCVLCQTLTHEDRAHMFFVFNFGQLEISWDYLGITTKSINLFDGGSSKEGFS